eukprot:TRINITY_DN66763_c0_g1_i1.p1 TRINITY_DN66763_c0_g1~~TRINITY_DN66763_c0_g1_i1.p1  ORF type:complete len:364 (-),score=68.14 TRINITY_DN66763_c0_g1_i1:18-1082(-)
MLSGMRCALTKSTRALFASSPSIPKPTIGEPKPLDFKSPSEDIAQRIAGITNMPQETFQEKFRDFNRKQQDAALDAARDDVFNMGISDKRTDAARLRVFFKSVAVEQVAEGWWTVLLDGRRLKALESRDTLLVPTEEMAYTVAEEWAEQQDYINKLIMPMTDIASGSQMVTEFGIAARIEHLMSFLGSDNILYRQREVEAKQKQLCDPVISWFEKKFNVPTMPRMQSLQSGLVPQSTIQKVQEALVAMELNQYQIVALYVVTRYTSSLILGLAAVHGVVPVEQVMAINKLEESYNIASSTHVEGYHDLRDTDVAVKVAASVLCWELCGGLSRERTAVPLQLLQGRTDVDEATEI